MAAAIPIVPTYTGSVPLIGQGEIEFSQNAQDNLTFQAALPPNLNTSIAAMNVLSVQLDESLTPTTVFNDDALFVLPPNAPIIIIGLRPQSLVGTLIDADGGTQRGAVLLEAVTGIFWGYSAPSGNAVGFSGVLHNLTDSAEGSQIFGGYVEKVATSIESVDASLYNVVKATETGAKTISFVNIPTLCYTCSITVIDGDGTLVITLPANTETPSGDAPAFTASGKDKLIFQTFDQGATWDLSVINDIKVIV